MRTVASKSSNLRSFVRSGSSASPCIDVRSRARLTSVYKHTRPLMRALFRDGIRSINSVLNADVNNARLCTSGSCLVLANENDEGEKQNTLASLEEEGDYVNGAKKCFLLFSLMRWGHSLREHVELETKACFRTRWFVEWTADAWIADAPPWRWARW